MRFKKILTIGLAESALDKKYWQQIDALCDRRVSISEDSNDIPKQLEDTDCLLVYFNGVDKKIIDQSSKLKYIGAMATGVGKIDIKYASTKGIIVTNLPGYSTESVAEFVFAVLLENLRDIERAKKESREGNRSEGGFTATEIKGKNFGILGLGPIGWRVAEIAQGFGANVKYWSRHKKNINKLVRYVEIDELVSQSDILSINLALTDETENILDKKRLSKLKKGMILINTAPMELVNINGLEARLKKGDITFIFDHTDYVDISQESLDRLHKYSNCISYPVLGYLSKEARLAKQEMFVENIRAFLKNKPQHIVKG